MYDIIIVGAGPAGLTAALYAKRAGKSVLIIEKENIGGQITFSPCVENYPSIKKISGMELADNLFEQVSALGAVLELEEVVKIESDGDVKKVICTDVEYEAKAVILACGSKHRHLGVDREDDMIGKGVSYCAVCDGAFFKGGTTAVVGGGNTALQDAVYLADICAKVYLIHRRDGFRADLNLVEKLKALPNVEFITPAVIKELVGNEKLTAIKVTSPDGENERTIEIDGLFVAVGQMPQMDNFSSVIKLDESGYADSAEDCRTLTEGVFVAGDCRKKSVRQLATAVSDGAVAALAACEYIDR